jgi:hypothetical protein
MCLDEMLLDAFGPKLGLDVSASTAADGVSSSIESHSYASFEQVCIFQFASLFGPKAWRLWLHVKTRVQRASDLIVVAPSSPPHLAAPTHPLSSHLSESYDVQFCVRPVRWCSNALDKAGGTNSTATVASL